MQPPVDTPYLTRADEIILQRLLNDVDKVNCTGPADKSVPDDRASMKLLADLNDASQAGFQPTVLTGWDWPNSFLPNSLNKAVLHPYVRWAQGVVRRPTDVVFLTHTLLYLSTLVPSVAYLFYRFSWVHALLHWPMQAFFCGPFTLMLHNHIHNNGVLDKQYAWLDRLVPYLLEPLMGHTWDSYYYHHVKHHHAEGNGPDDLSSTIRYQRDELTDFLAYFLRFLVLIWIELPLYFLRKRKRALAIKAFTSEMLSYLAIYLLAQYNFRATLMTMIVPLLQMRFGMMVGNWGQHAFVDEDQPDSDFRSSITLIDVSSNRYCFNDGYHTSHHLNPRCHWRDHPLSFLKAKSQYQSEGALVFQNIDFIMITFRLLRKDYTHLASCLIPMGSQIGLSQNELAAMLRTKTRRFTEEEIQMKYRKKVFPARK